MLIKKNKQEILKELQEELNDLKEYGGDTLETWGYMLLGKVIAYHDLGILTDNENASWVKVVSNVQFKKH